VNLALVVREKLRVIDKGKAGSTALKWVAQMRFPLHLKLLFAGL
jgi:hypothetical protein